MKKGLESIPEVPFPDMVLTSTNQYSIMKSRTRSASSTSRAIKLYGGWWLDLEYILACIAAPGVPFPVPSDEIIDCKTENHCNVHGLIRRVRSFFTIYNVKATMVQEISDAKYIVRQYIASTGGVAAIYGMETMFASGKVKTQLLVCKDERDKDMVMSLCMCRRGGADVGAFVLWLKRPDLWSLELAVSSGKILAGSDGRTTWRRAYPNASRGPFSLFRPFLQGLDPRSTANLFMDSIYTGDKAIDGEDCFILEVQAESSTLTARISNKVHIIKHTMHGYFNQKSGILVKLEDSHLLRIKMADKKYTSLSTSMVSQIRDYRFVDGINIAHGGRTFVSITETGSECNKSSRVEMEEVWKIEDVGFNMKGLHKDCFLPPRDVKNAQQVSSIFPVRSSTNRSLQK